VEIPPRESGSARTLAHGAFLLGHNHRIGWPALTVDVPAASLWIEIGKNESVTNLDSEFEVDTDYLKEIVRLYHSVAIFHFHPAGFYSRIRRHEPYPIDFPAGSIEHDRLQPVGFALPSPDDVVSPIELSRMLTADNPAAHISYAVVSPYGIIAYGLTAVGLKR